MRINVNFGAAIAGWNAIASAEAGSSGTSIEDLLDDTGALTGISLSKSGASYADGKAASSHYGLPTEYWDAIYFLSSGTLTVTLAGLSAYDGQPFTVTTAGFSKSATERVMDFQVNGGTAQRYTSRTTEPPDAPLTFTGTVSGDTMTIQSTLVTGLAVCNGFVLELDAVSTPTITDIDGDESVYPGQSFVITGTNFGATQGTGTVDIDGVAQTVTAWSDTSITCTAVRGGNEYGTGKTLTVTTDAGTTATLNVAQEAQPDTFAVTAASPNTTDPASLWSNTVDTATGDPETVVNGDQFWVNSTIPGLAIDPTGAITANETGTFTGQFWKASEGVWGSDQTVSFTLPSEALTPLELRKKQNKRRRYTANLLGAWRNRFIGEDDE